MHSDWQSKMSKSKGNVVPALSTLQMYGEDAVRFYFLKEGPQDRDESFHPRLLVELHNAHIVNELGNPTKRHDVANSLNRVSSPNFLPSEAVFRINAPSSPRDREFVSAFNKKAGTLMVNQQPGRNDIRRQYKFI